MLRGTALGPKTPRARRAATGAGLRENGHPQPVVEFSSQAEPDATHVYGTGRRRGCPREVAQ